MKPMLRQEPYYLSYQFNVSAGISGYEIVSAWMAKREKLQVSFFFLNVNFG